MIYYFYKHKIKKEQSRYFYDYYDYDNHYIAYCKESLGDKYRYKVGYYYLQHTINDFILSEQIEL